MELDVSKALRKTEKGSLKYDRSAPTKEFFEHCSPPSLSVRYSDKNSPDNRITAKLQNKRKVSYQKSDDSGSIYDNVLQITIRSDSSSQKSEIVSPVSTEQQNQHVMPVSPEYTKSILAVQEYEDSLEREKKNKMYYKHKEFTEYSRKLQNDAQNELLCIHRNQLNKAKEQQQETELQFMQQSIELEEKQRKLKEDHRQHAQMLQKKNEKLKEEVKRKERERQDRIQQAKRLHNDIETISNRCNTMFEQCTFKDRLPESVKKGIELVNHKHIHVSQMAIHDIDEADKQKLMETVKLCLNAYEFLKKEIDELSKKISEERKIEAEKKAKEEAEKKAREEAENKAKAAASANSALVPPTPSLAVGPLASSTPSAAPASNRERELRCVDENAFLQYTKLQEQIKKAEDDAKTLFNNPQMKKLKFDIQKSVNTPINNISPVSGEHLRDKLQRLLSLLAGQTVELSGKRFSLSSCEQALPFCKNLIAKMIVKKGEEQVSSKHKSAFAIAAVTVGLISEHPDILPLLLGHFHQLCPYTVPYHITKQDRQSMDDYLRALGYKYDSDNNIEKQDQFLKRMSGIMRLYASILVAFPPRGPNPYRTEHAWAWLSMVMNIEPLPDITATMTFDLLEVTGHALYRQYKKQFFKLLHVLIKEFLPKLQKVASPSGGGPMTRLKEFLETSVKHNGNIPPPEGLLNAHFWMS